MLMKTLLVLSMLILSACTAFVAKPVVKLKDVKLAGLKSEGLDLDFYLTVYNPNSYDIHLTNYRYELKIMSRPLARGNSRTTHDLGAKSQTDIMIPAKVPYKGLIEVLKRRPNPEVVPYQLNAELTVGTAVGNLNVPLTMSGDFTIPREYRLEKVLNRIDDFIKGLRE